MPGHATVRRAVRDHLALWVPARLLLLRDAEGLTGPADPRAYLLADGLPDNDPSRYPCIVVSSTRTRDMKRRNSVCEGVPLAYDVTYEVTVLVAVTAGQFAGDEAASLDRDVLLQAVRESLMLPADIGHGVEVLGTPSEVTGAASQTLRGEPLAAGTATVLARATEVLLPAADLAQIVGIDLSIIPHDTEGAL